MPKKTNSQTKAPVSTPGPKPQYLKIEGDWRDAVKQAIQKKRPPEGWPK